MRVRRWQHRVLWTAWAYVHAAVILCLLGAAGRVGGQSPQPATPYTFRIYEDLVQIPTLVTDRRNNSLPNLRLTDFTIRLDSGPAFHPRHERLQGDDPMHVVIFLDTSSGDPTTLEDRWKSVFAALPPDWLSPRDSFAVYASDCNLVRTPGFQPYTHETLVHSLSNVLNTHDLHKPRGTDTSCSVRGRLWDELATVTTGLAGQPKWSAILALTDGVDERSVSTWKQLQHYAGSFSISILGLRPRVQERRPASLAYAPGRRPPTAAKDEDAFTLLCGGTGGLVETVAPDALGAAFQHTVALLRTRYILEFARPLNGTPGIHDISVRVPDRQAIVSVSGISFPTQNKELLTAPNTLQSDPSRAPLTGDRRILTAPQ